MDQTPSWEDIISDAMDVALDQRWTAQPAVVVSYDPATRSASCQATIKHTYVDENGDNVAEILPTIPGIPVVFGFAGGGFDCHAPLAAGDIVLLVHTCSSIAQWRVGNGATTDPGMVGLSHDFRDAIAIAGLRAFQGNRITDMSGLTFGAINGPQVQVTSSAVKLGSTSAVDAAVKGTTYRAAEDVLFGALTTFVAAINTASIPLGPYPNPALVTACAAMTAALTAFHTASASYLSTIVKVA